ncbi:MAG: M20/M25/M40 family metallo-hydrolase [Alphaproteobacteria bacterium]|nr:M20/M25/M40 family metallo-hydrolase [Alphaproteobacteria bacterium]MBU1514689.1 M20/M25/M40 family metallo-hydrolase [Alphaproteobacteria bacterium]MBU2093548.1 M20/M25/M40 family metallo-hydrolase [Alphaproteobacteria bacterium]MBU2149462.1 M20/M25/M40 family metallo-hydrolase [Alphaproteobacteria bacterium]MBU2305495.1 M20/M25/M40 family metallo-hydrolase [Alphaproteobacteria bacterium]
MTANTDRRALLAGAAALGAATLAPATGLAKEEYADVKKALSAGHDAAVKRLQDWIKLPSIAAENLNYPAGAEYMKQLALDAGFQHAEIVPSSGKPGVFATLDAGAKKTLGLYFMYDVKQFVPSEWESPPLEGRILDRPGLGKVVMGRGAVNQKGPETTVLHALHAMKAAGRKLPVNLVLVCEGEEEIASPNFHEIVGAPQVAAALKKSVGVIIPFASQSPSTGAVTINLGAKGALELEMVVSGEKWGRGPKGDIHSSQKARVDSPPWRLVAALSSLVSPDGNTVVIDGIPEMVRPLTARERELIAMTAAKTSEADSKAQLGVSRWIDDMTWEQSLERLAAVPTVNIQGLIAGYTGPGGKTVLPGKATAKIELRLVPNMTKDDTVRKLRAHLDKRGFNDVEVNVSGGYGPTETAEDAALTKAQIAAYKRFGAATTLYPRLAGSWPGVIFTGPPLNLPAGQFGLGYGNGAHAPNEIFLIESANPTKVAGMDEAALGFVDFLYQVAAIG